MGRVAWGARPDSRPSGVHGPAVRPLQRFTLTLVLLVVAAHTALARGEEPDSLGAREGRTGFLFLPIVYYTPETGVAGGAALLMVRHEVIAETRARPSSLLLDFIYTQKRQLIAEMYPDVYFHDGEYHVVGSLYYARYPQKYFGIGNDMPDSLEEQYSSRAFRVSADVVRRIVPNVDAGLSGYFESRTFTDFEQGGQLAPLTISGSAGGRVVGLGLVSHWDTRDHLFSPRTGRLYQLTWRVYSPKFGSDFDFGALTLDLREYFPVWEAATVGVQFLGTVSSGNVPFFMLAKVGGGYSMRGYYEGRYRDKDLLTLQGEFRFPLVWRFRGATFICVGDVAPELSRFSLRNIKPSYGLGLRYIFDPLEKLCIRFDLGMGRGSSGVYITANEAF
jgi:outer membrane protein assembly factor BamA